MGGSHSVSQSPVFEPILQSLSRPLTIEELWAIPVPQCTKYIDMKDLSVLYRLDADKDGRFSKKDIIAFAEFVNVEARTTTDDRHLGMRIMGQCTCELVYGLETQANLECVAEWALRLLGESIGEEEIKILLQTFGRPLDDFSDLIEIASTSSVTAYDIKHHFLSPLLRHYCDLMNSIGIAQALDD